MFAQQARRGPALAGALHLPDAPSCSRSPLRGSPANAPWSGAAGPLHGPPDRRGTGTRPRALSRVGDGGGTHGRRNLDRAGGAEGGPVAGVQKTTIHERSVVTVEANAGLR